MGAHIKCKISCDNIECLESFEILLPFYNGSEATTIIEPTIHELPNGWQLKNNWYSRNQYYCSLHNK